MEEFSSTISAVLRLTRSTIFGKWSFMRLLLIYGAKERYIESSDRRRQSSALCTTAASP